MASKMAAACCEAQSTVAAMGCPDNPFRRRDTQLTARALSSWLLCYIVSSALGQTKREMKPGIGVITPFIVERCEKCLLHEIRETTSFNSEVIL